MGMPSLIPFLKNPNLLIINFYSSVSCCAAGFAESLPVLLEVVVDSSGLEVVVSAGLLVVVSAGFEVVDEVFEVEDVLLDEVLEDVLSPDEVSSDEVFIADGSTSSKMLPPWVVQGLSWLVLYQPIAVEEQ